MNAPHITQDHEIILTLTRDQFIVLMGALGAAEAVISGDDEMTPEMFTEAVQNPILQDLIANLKEPLTQALAGHMTDQAEQARPDDSDGAR